MYTCISIGEDIGCTRDVDCREKLICTGEVICLEGKCRCATELKITQRSSEKECTVDDDCRNKIVCVDDPSCFNRIKCNKHGLKLNLYNRYSIMYCYHHQTMSLIEIKLVCLY